MTLTFDAGVPRRVQLTRSDRRKRKGRKHEKRIGPTRKRPPGIDPMKAGKARKHSERVAAFWRGEIDSHPDARVERADMPAYLFRHYGVVTHPTESRQPSVPAPRLSRGRSRP